MSLAIVPVAAGLAILIFIVDILTHAEIVVAFLYVGVLLVFARFSDWWVNVLEAMSDISEGARELTIMTEKSGPSAVLVTVLDTGQGVEPQRLEEISTPSTRPRMKEWGWDWQ